ncbi:MAG: ABC transporter permease [Cellulomonadaceae bacterium]
MFRLTFAQMRRSIGRLTAAGIAIAIGTAFVAATLLAGNVMTRTSYETVAAGFGQAQIVVTGESDGWSPLTDQQLTTMAATPGVAAVQPLTALYVDFTSAQRTTMLSTVAAATDARLDAQELVEGNAPSEPGQVALPQSAAERLGVGVGDTVQVTVPDADTGDATAVDTTVVGLVTDPNGAYAVTDGAAVVDAADFTAWAEAGWGAEAANAAVLVADGADVGQVIDRLETALASDAGDVAVQTRDERAAQSVNDFTGGQQILTFVVLAFAAVALLVAGLVIANTFQVLVAQRTRTLALLRCVGANKGQLRRSVLTEAAVLGVIASLAGIVLGAAVVQGLLAVLRTIDIGVPLPATIDLSLAVVLVPLLAGVLVTTISALSPARAATRVSPLAALRPADAPTTRSGAGTVRLVLSALMIVGGLILLGGGVALGLRGSAGFGLLLGIAGGGASFIGLIVAAVFWVPVAIRVAGRLAARGGPAARLAAANTVRNPRRTAATSTALLIGVTLVTMMSTGAVSARATLENELDSSYPVDVAVVTQALATTTGGQTGLPDAAIDQIAATSGVGAVAPIVSAPVTLDGEQWDAQGLDPARAGDVVHDARLIAPLADDTVLLSSWMTDTLGVRAGDTLAVGAADGAESVELRVEVSTIATDGPLLTATALARLGAPVTTAVWVALDGTVAPATVASDLQDQADAYGGYVTGAAVERAMIQQVIDTMLAVVVGLLGVAVVIALIGVANTLSLSVLERQRENAMLRAIGLSKRQLRTTLAVEGTLIALVGAVLGVALGLGYGWAGAAAALGSLGELTLAVPWRDLALVVVVALAAGLLASVIPARRAVRTSPVEALAVE